MATEDDREIDLTDQTIDTTEAPEPGWYPDPTHSRKERLWDGSQWLNWSRKRRESPEEHDPPAWKPDPSSSRRERFWSGDQWTDSIKEIPEEVDEVPMVECPSCGRRVE